jgi:choline dehydrogenase-like flavoprotein
MIDAALTDRERRVLAAVADTFAPQLEPGPGDDPALFRLSAKDLGLAAALEQAIVGGALSTRQISELRLFLRLLDSSIGMLLLARQPRGITGMTPEQRERAMHVLARSAIPQIRAGYQAIRRLSTFLFYSVTPDGTQSPTWPGLGYSVPPATRMMPATLRVQSPKRAMSFEADVCIVGSGAGGGVMADRLTAAGMSVVLLEMAPGDQAPDFDNREIAGMQRLYLDQGTTASRDLSVAILAGQALGGGTTVNWQTSLRLPDAIRDEWATSSGIRDFVEEPFTAALDSVWRRMSVSMNESAHNANNLPLQRGCQALGYSWHDIARNSRGCDLSRCGYCVFGCKVGGKQSTARTFLEDAQATGRLTIVANCRADYVFFEQGRAAGVAATLRTEHGVEKVKVRARNVVVSAGAIETPALLLRSGVAHAELGRNLFLHPTSAVAGRYPDETRGWIGAPQTVLCDEFGSIDGNYGFRLETAPVHPGLIALAQAWHGARDHRAKMQLIAHLSAFIVLSRDRNTGRVSLERDGRARVDYRVGRDEQALLKRGIAEASRVHWAAGATEIHTLHVDDHTFRRGNASADDFRRWHDRIRTLPVGDNRCGVFSAHQMGTCRMGSDPARDVCDANGAVHGKRGLYVADASLFPLSSGVNPMITIMAMAHMIGSRFTQVAR